MLSTIEGLKDDLKNLAGVLNQFRSEAVQIKLLDQFFEILKVPVEMITPSSTTSKRRGRPPKIQDKVIKPTKVAARKMKRKSMGATGAINALISKGYFKQRRSIAEIVQACESKVGIPIKVTNLSGPLGKFVEDKKLLRATNKMGRFEYWAK